MHIAEATTLQQGILQARQLSLDKLQIEGDNQLVINFVNNVWTPPWRIAPLIQDIQALLSQFQDLNRLHIFREANQAADWIANVSHLVTSLM